MALASVGQELPGFSRKLGLSSDLMVLENAWQRELGNLREDAHIAAVDRNALIVDVRSATVMQEISLRRKELIRRLNRHLPVPMIEQIIVRMRTNG